MRGATQLPWAMESRLLFDLTDGTVLPVVDNVAGDHVSEVWDEAVVLVASIGREAAGDYLRSSLDPKLAIEYKFLAQFLSRAIEYGCESRVQPIGLGKKDVLFYLPVGCFTERLSSWDELLEAHVQALSSGATKVTDWKKWATASVEAQFDDATIREALSTVEETPSECVRLMTLCQSLIEVQQ